MSETQRLSAIILAAGANTRLAGLVPGFMKPLVLVNGRPLIKHALDHAGRWNADEIVIVASPENAKLLSEVVTLQTVDWVLQPRPVGLGDALSRALPYVNSHNVLILCSDNTFEPGELARDHTRVGLVPEGEGVIATRDLKTIEAARRFTRVASRGDDGPVTAIIGKGDAAHEKNGVDNYAETRCWIGPLVLPAHRLRETLENPQPEQVTDEMADIIRRSTKGMVLRALPMRCSDLGVPEALA